MTVDIHVIRPWAPGDPMNPAQEYLVNKDPPAPWSIVASAADDALRPSMTEAQIYDLKFASGLPVRPLIQTASAEALDMIGATRGVPRLGRTDAAYREALINPPEMPATPASRKLTVDDEDDREAAAIRLLMTLGPEARVRVLQYALERWGPLPHPEWSFEVRR